MTAVTAPLSSLRLHLQSLAATPHVFMQLDSPSPLFSATGQDTQLCNRSVAGICNHQRSQNLHFSERVHIV